MCNPSIEETEHPQRYLVAVAHLGVVLRTEHVVSDFHLAVGEGVNDLELHLPVNEKRALPEPLVHLVVLP